MSYCIMGFGRHDCTLREAGEHDLGRGGEGLKRKAVRGAPDLCSLII